MEINSEENERIFKLFILSSDQLPNVHWHFVNLQSGFNCCSKPFRLTNLCGVVLLNVAQNADVVVLDKVDGHTLAAITTGTSNSVDVQLAVVGQVVVDDQ